MLPATGRVCPECKCPVAVLDDARPDAPRNSLSTVRRADIDGGGETNKTPPVVPGAMPRGTHWRFITHRRCSEPPAEAANSVEALSSVRTTRKVVAQDGTHQRQAALSHRTGPISPRSLEIWLAKRPTSRCIRALRDGGDSDAQRLHTTGPVCPWRRSTRTTAGTLRQHAFVRSA